MSKIVHGATPRCGKTVMLEKKEKIRKILENMPYHYYPNDVKHQEVREQIKSGYLNCRDPSPHEDEINALAALGLSYPTIRKIIENKYYPNLKD